MATVHTINPNASSTRTLGDAVSEMLFGDETSKTDTDRHGILGTIGDCTVKGFGYTAGVVLGIITFSSGS